MRYTIGIDSSTTATKALLMDADGRVVAIGRSEYGFDTPRPQWSEQDPRLWWDATVAALRQVISTTGINASEVDGIGLTGQMHGLVALDADGDVLRPAILWNDQRTQAECDEIRATVGRDRLIGITGNDALAGFTAPKILWVRNHEQDVYARIEHVLLPKDYVRFRLTGDYATDKAGASGTILFDLATRDWSSDVLADLDIPRAWLPPTHEGTSKTGALSADAAAATGLRAGTPVFGGGGDQAANGVGLGAVRPGVVAVSLGTSGVVFAATEAPVIEPLGRLHAFCHAVPGMWHLMGVMLSAAGSLQWFRRALAPDLGYEEIDDMASGVRAGANGLVFLPYLTGERTPHPDPLARGAFVGLTVRHGLGHLARAVMEGVAFGLEDAAGLIRSVSPVDEIRVSGGGAASPVWMQILADVFGSPVRSVGTPESAAHGAALLAATGAGMFPSVDAATDAVVEVGDPVEPGPDASVYAETAAVYRGLYPALRPSFAGLAALDG